MTSLTQTRLSRRELLKIGAGASLALTTVGLTATLSGCSSSRPSSDFEVLRDSDLPVLAALLPALVGNHPALTNQPQAITATLRQLDISLAHTSAAIQKDVHDLLGLLSLPLTRGPLTGIWGSWEQASPERLEAFLQRWRDSRLEMLRQGYKALSQLLLMAWYALPLSWETTGYPGPPQI
ncbi:twin-arginine translocation pathway signal protein [Pseudomonas jilinensis]|uniref:Twin-arginine translocation pathway signal protein n=1 Tax=Pseudomonas jilinensis TaxID=2078689 RepID=A0A396S0L5_9PSED|nr:twin-arginine translocation pathway signal protein [Pseudomonas jilinensis]RHW21212.1 twin-arginine translocation pathway signal protein [Pseudomonas jilinensis]